MNFLPKRRMAGINEIREFHNLRGWKGAGADESSKAVWRYRFPPQSMGCQCMECGGKAQRRHRFGFFA
jgi:hypothetical protein